MHKKLFSIFIIFLLSLTISYSADEPGELGDPHCSTAAFCGGDYEAVCSRTSDGICPQAYGDWGSCATNIYEGVKCFPCDPDCAAYGVCGDIEATIEPSCVQPGGGINVPTYVSNGDNLQLIVTYAISETCDNPSFTIYDAVECPPQNDFCELEPVNTITAPNVGGQCYQIRVELGHMEGNTYIGDESIILSDSTEPSLFINNPGPGTTQLGDVEINIDADSDILKEIQNGPDVLRYAQYYLYKKQPGGEFLPTDAETCQINCQGEDCNLIGSLNGIPPGEISYNWDSTICDNKEIKIEVRVADYATCIASEEVSFVLQNNNPPCVDDCPIFSSSLFKTILARIKVWL